jgi:voltage-gated potassium channel
MKRKRGDVLIALLCLAEILVLINTVQILLPRDAVSIAIFAFDFFVVTLIIFSFCRRMKDSGQWKKFLLRNWYEVPGMIPIVVFALAGLGSPIYHAL